MDSLFNYFDHFLRLSPESKALIAAQVELENVKKGEFLWKAGQRCSKLYFMQAGIARLFFYNEAGEENTVHFVSANQFMADLESLNAKTPSSVSCVAAADCAVLTISCTALEKLNKEVFEWHELLRKITEKSLFDKIKVRDSIFKKEAKERYVAFLAQFPTIAGSVPANHIASYLGISPFTLSHLKKELANSDFLRISKN